MSILSFIVAILFITIVINLIFKRLGISLIVGYIISGIFLGSFLDFDLLISKESLSHIGEFGIVFLMFTLGLEFSLNHLKNMKKEVFLYGGLQVLITTTLFSYLLIYMLNLNIKTAIIISFAISLSSTALVIKSLSINNDIHRPYGRHAFGILLFHDLSVIPILLLISFFSNFNSSIGIMILDTIASAIGIIIVMYLFGKYILDKFLEHTLDNKNEELFVSAILFIVLASSSLAYFLGFTYSLGAFIAGMLISETKYKYKVESDLAPFRDLLLGLFFITVGMQVDIFSLDLQKLKEVIILTLIVLFIKAVVMFIILAFFIPFRRAVKVSLVLAHLGSFSFVILAQGLNSGLIDNNLYQTMLLMVVLSLIITSLVITDIRPFIDSIIPKGKENRITSVLEPMSNHIIVCGYSVLGQHVVKKLKTKKIDYIAIEKNVNLVKNGLDVGDNVYLGNASSTKILENCNIKDAKGVILTIDDDKMVRLIVDSINQIDKKIPIVVKVSHQTQIDDLKDLSIKSFVNANISTAGILVQKAIED